LKALLKFGGVFLIIKKYIVYNSVTVLKSPQPLFDKEGLKNSKVYIQYPLFSRVTSELRERGEVKGWFKTKSKEIF
jgi:hypothetical protein